MRDAGTMFVLGHSVPRDRDKALARVGAIVDEPRFHGHLTGRENLQILAAAREPEARRPHHGVARACGHSASSRRQGVDLLDGHAPAARCCRMPARRSGAAHPGRTDERPRSRRHAGHARDDPFARRRRPHSRVVVPPARRGASAPATRWPSSTAVVSCVTGRSPSCWPVPLSCSRSDARILIEPALWSRRTPLVSTGFGMSRSSRADCASRCLQGPGTT